jgi:hypothetical protein
MEGQINNLKLILKAQRESSVGVAVVREEIHPVYKFCALLSPFKIMT